uniref:Uncharacterized protein n=1 Tax=Ditylenchus dipsaci TaxID=166011 RepID=A0A915DGS6_9BILA
MNHNLRSRVPNKRTFGFDLRDRTQVAQYEASKGRADISSSSNQSATNNGEPDMCRISEGTEKSPMVKSATPKRQAILTPKKVGQSTPCKTSDPLKRKRPVSTPKHQKPEQPIFCIDQYFADLSNSHINKFSLAQLLSLKTIVDDKIQKKSEETENLEDNCTPKNVHTQAGQVSVELEKKVPLVSDLPELCMQINQEGIPTKESKKENDVIGNEEADNTISSN